MKFCPNCGVTLADDATFCTSCGNPLTNGQPTPPPAQGYAPNTGYGYAPVNYAPVDPYDHTAEFDPKDISENKVICMLIYLSGVVGILVALLLANTSRYVGFHVRQALKFEVATILATLATVLLFWTIIVPIVYGILMVALVVVRIICFFQICSGKAKEPAIIRSLGFMR